MAKSKTQDLLVKIELSSKEEIEGVKIPSATDILKAGGHFGHSARRWHPAYKPFLYTKKKGIYIINAEKSVESFKQAIKALIDAVKQGKKVLLVGTKKQASPLVKEFGEKYGVFYLTKKWPAGFFSNFEQIKASIDKLLVYKEQYIKRKYSLTKKELLDLERKIQKLEDKYGGVTFMNQLPDLVIIIDIVFEKVALKEARLAKIPVLAIVDSNADPRLVEYPVLMNDDAIKALQVFFTVLSDVFEKYGDKTLNNTRKNFNEHLAELEKEMDATYGKAGPKVSKEKASAKSDDVEVVRVVAYTPIDDVKVLPKKLRESLKLAGIQSKEALERLSFEELVNIRGIGPRTARSIINKMKNLK